jgi:hypothetical protein
MFVWLCLIPVVEAAEQTILQKVVPPERQGRVFGFAQSVEQAASPITAFLIGPVAQLFFIPFMTNGAGVQLLGDWFGTGTDRGIALLFTVSGLIGLFATLLAMRTYSYRVLSENYQQPEVVVSPELICPATSEKAFDPGNPKYKLGEKIRRNYTIPPLMKTHPRHGAERCSRPWRSGAT